MTADFRNILLRPDRAGRAHYNKAGTCWEWGRALFPPSLGVSAFSRINPSLQPTLQLHTSVTGRGKEGAAGLKQEEDRSKMRPSRGFMGSCQTGVATPLHSELPRKKILILLGKYRSPPILLQRLPREACELWNTTQTKNVIPLALLVTPDNN